MPTTGANSGTTPIGNGLRVAVDARPLTTSRAGVATYCRGLLYGFGLLPAGEAPSLRLYAKEAAPEPLPTFVGSWRAMPAPLWLPLAVPRALLAGHVDVFHGPNHMAPPWSPVPTVITAHDLSALTMGGLHTWRNRLLTVPQMLLSLRRAERLIAVSRATASDLLRLPGIDAERVRVIYEAAAPGLTPATPEQVRALSHRLALPETFFLFLGALEPRKNVVTLVRALAELYAAGDHRAKLVIAGAEGWRNDDVYDEVKKRGLERDIRFAGYIPAEDLPALYGAATAFVYPSLFEGFGLPPLEAMACGTPVICSNTSSLPEVVGDAAITVDPLDTSDLAAALRTALDDADLRARLSHAGLQRAALFSWERTARETLEVYREAAGERRRLVGGSEMRVGA